MFTRRNVYRLGEPWADDVLWYARGVQAMESRPLADPTSWRFFAAIHGFDVGRWTALGAYSATEPQPSPSAVLLFWDQCQHGTWHFLPWHRGYLLAIEATLRQAITDLGGPGDTWAMPYWNYFATGEADLPQEFATPRWPDGDDGNPLFVEARFGPGGNGDVYVPMPPDPNAPNLDAMREPEFTGPDGGASRGFGGIDIGFTHGGRKHGQLEQQPHDQVHGLVGGQEGGIPTGLMGAMADPRTAGLDPIFWLHHANIDRLWSAWADPGQGHTDPTDPDWLNGPASMGQRRFCMPRPDGSPWVYTPAQMGSTTALGYEYDDLTPGAAAETDGAAVAPVAEVADVAVPAGAGGGAAVTEPGRNVEMVGASDATDLPLRATPTRAVVGLDPGTLRRSTAAMVAADASAPSAPERVFLNLENVRGTSDATIFSVYVGLPADAEPTEHPELLAGSVSLFGLTQASDPEGEHSGDGITYVLEISDVVRNAHLEEAVEADQLPVTLVPRRPSDARSVDVDPPGADVDPDVTIGRVTLFRQGA